MTQEELQREWDLWLIQAWYATEGDHNVVWMWLNFCRRYDLDPVEATIRRKPKMYMNCTVRRFICGYLKKIADYLFTQKDREKALNAVTKCKIDTQNQAAESWSIRRDKRMAKKVKEDHNTVCEAKAASAEEHGKHLASAWSTCK